MTRSSRLIAALVLAVERNAPLLNAAQGLSEVRINIKLDREGLPCRALITPMFELRLVSKPLKDFTFDST